MAKYFTCIEIEESEYFLGIPNNVKNLFNEICMRVTWKIAWNEFLGKSSSKMYFEIFIFWNDNDVGWLIQEKYLIWENTFFFHKTAKLYITPIFLQEQNKNTVEAIILKKIRLTVKELHWLEVLWNFFYKLQNLGSCIITTPKLFFDAGLKSTKYYTVTHKHTNEVK